MPRRADTKGRKRSTRRVEGRGERGEGRGDKDGESNIHARTHAPMWRLRHLCRVECARDVWAKV